MHIFWRIAHTPFHAFDNDEIAEEIAIEGVKEEEPPYFENARSFGDQKSGIRDMFEEIHRAYDIETRRRFLDIELLSCV